MTREVVPNFKAGVKTSAGAAKKWQQAVRVRDNYTCRRCGTQDPYISTHHIGSKAQRPDLKYDVDNGVCLCIPCHGFVHSHPLEAQELGLMSNERYEMRNG